MTHICVRLTITGSDNSLSLGRCQTIIWTSAGILLIGPSGTNFNETSIEIYTFSFKKIHLKLSSEKWRPFCIGLIVLTGYTHLRVTNIDEYTPNAVMKILILCAGELYNRRITLMAQAMNFSWMTRNIPVVLVIQLLHNVSAAPASDQRSFPDGTFWYGVIMAWITGGKTSSDTTE